MKRLCMMLQVMLPFYILKNRPIPNYREWSVDKGGRSRINRPEYISAQVLHPAPHGVVQGYLRWKNCRTIEQVGKDESSCRSTSLCIWCLEGVCRVCCSRCRKLSVCLLVFLWKMQLLCWRVFTVWHNIFSAANQSPERMCLFMADREGLVCYGDSIGKFIWLEGLIQW